GADNQFEKNKELQDRYGTPTIPEFLEKQFKDSEIMLNMVFFELAKNEKQDVDNNFKVIERKQWRVPGKIYFEEDAKQLAATLSEALRQRLRYWIDTADERPVTSETGLDVSL